MNSKGCFESIAIHISYDCFQSKLESVSARIFIKRTSLLNQFSLNLDSTLLKNKEKSFNHYWLTIYQTIRVNAYVRRFSFKEVIQPQVPLGLPCYDFTPVMNHSVVIALPKVRLTTSGATHSHGVTGGVYKARERIHRDILIHDY